MRHEPALGRMVAVAARVARQMGVEATGYRLASNTGDDAGQTVFTCTCTVSAAASWGPRARVGRLATASCVSTATVPQPTFAPTALDARPAPISRDFACRLLANRGVS
jgi:HIT domain